MLCKKCENFHKNYENFLLRPLKTRCILCLSPNKPFYDFLHNNVLCKKVQKTLDFFNKAFHYLYEESWYCQ